jgi:CPA2 family monovalent cation:H+ antiporter-2/glutathione-regulated potassium-efflux system ancillary protein KefC
LTGYLVGAFVYLCAALIAVPVARRLGLGSVLGYLIAGVAIGPVLGLVGEETETLQHFAEFGVVMMLFLVGLELEPRSLWQMRGQLLGLGGLQVGVTGALFAGGALALGLPWQTALAVGAILALSSTAIVLQTFAEKGLGRVAGGRAAFSVLLFQDIAVIPMLALIPLLALPELAAGGAGHGGGHEEMSLVAGLAPWAQALVTIGAIGFVVAGGHFLSGPLFRFVARAGLREAFTTAALALVTGVAALMTLVGLSPALGTFLAGVVLANSEFRHELETDIEPFKGLLLGLFFITVGAGIRFPMLAEDPGGVIGLTVAIMVLKAAVLFGLAIVFGVRRSDGWLFTLSLAQAGEFGFVLLSFGVQNAVLAPALAAKLSLSVALSMFLTPLLFIVFDRLVVPRYAGGAEEREADTVDERGPVIIAGVGRFGQIVNRMLTAAGVKTVVLDREIGQIENMRRVRFKTFFGDVTRPDLLHSAGAAEASLFVVAIDESDQAVSLVRHLKDRYPNLSVLARSFDRGHLYRLREAGADRVVMETYHSAVELGTDALRQLGNHPFKAEQLRAAFDAVEREGREQLYRAWLERPEGERLGTDYLNLFMQLHDLLSERMGSHRDDRHSRSERGWTPPPKGYATQPRDEPSD